MKCTYANTRMVPAQLKPFLALSRHSQGGGDTFGSGNTRTVCWSAASAAREFQPESSGVFLYRALISVQLYREIPQVTGTIRPKRFQLLHPEVAKAHDPDHRLPIERTTRTVTTVRTFKNVRKSVIRVFGLKVRDYL